MPHGGYRPGAGRPKGSFKRQKKGKAAKKRDIDTAFRGDSPKEYLLSVMRDPSVDVYRRDKAAIAAAPYCHAKIERAAKPGKKQLLDIAAAQAGQDSEWGTDLQVPGEVPFN